MKQMAQLKTRIEVGPIKTHCGGIFRSFSGESGDDKIWGQ